MHGCCIALDMLLEEVSAGASSICPVLRKLRVIKGALSPVAHALASENKLEKDGRSFSSSVGDFGRLFLAIEISAIVR